MIATEGRKGKQRGKSAAPDARKSELAINYLKTNKDYNAEEVFAQTREWLEDKSLQRKSPLQDVKVQLLGKLGRHGEALHILIYYLNNINKV